MPERAFCYLSNTTQLLPGDLSMINCKAQGLPGCPA